MKRLTFWYFVDVLKIPVGYTHSKVGHQVMFLEIELKNMTTVTVTSKLYDYNYNYYFWYGNKFGN